MAALLRSVSSPATSGVAICSTLTPPRCSVTGRVTLRLTGTSKRSGSVPSSEIDSEREAAAGRRAEVLDAERRGSPPRRRWRRRARSRRRRGGPSRRRCRSGAPAPGRGSSSSASGSCTWPSVTRIAPAMRSAGSSAVASASAVRSWVPSSPRSATCTVRTSSVAALPEPVEPRLEPVERLGELGVAAVDAVRGAVVDDDDGDVRHRRAVLAPERRPGERGEQHQRREPAQPPAGQPAPERHARSRRASAPPAPRSAAAAAAGRRRSTACYCPSRSSSAGTCTWSDL